MKEITYSVIVPAYNVAEYLTECIESILSQKSEYSFELILVDDGSTDGTGAICDAYSNDERIRVIHQPNSGVSAARNTGIQNSRGKYLLFVDGDDLWADNMLQVLDSYAKSDKNTVFFSYILEHADGTTEVLDSPLNKISGDAGKEYLQKALYSAMGVPAAVWMWMLSASIIRENDLLFDTTLTICEDHDFIMRYLPLAEKVLSTGSNLYIYRYREDSVTKTINADKLIMVIENRAIYCEMYHSPALANRWIDELIAICRLQDKKDIARVVNAVKKHRHILKDAAGLKSKIKALMLSVFGVFRGAKIIQFICRFT